MKKYEIMQKKVKDMQQQQRKDERTSKKGKISLIYILGPSR
jgi:hypothetical protein